MTSPIAQSSVVPSDLFISEVTDANTGALSYVELYNGTGASKNLSNYKLKCTTMVMQLQHGSKHYLEQQKQ